MSGKRPGRGDAGFTLLETLVALAILGVVMTTVYGVIGSGLRSAHRDEDRLLLGLVAQNLLARSQLDLDPAGGARSGDIGGGLRWRIESEPYAVPQDILPEAPAGLDDPLLPPAEDGGETPTTAGLGSRGAEANERGGFTGSGPGETRRSSAEEGVAREENADEPATPRQPLRLRLIRVVVEKGDQRYALSTLAVETPLARPSLR